MPSAQREELAIFCVGASALLDGFALADFLSCFLVGSIFFTAVFFVAVFEAPLFKATGFFTAFAGAAFFTALRTAVAAFFAGAFLPALFLGSLRATFFAAAGMSEPFTGKKSEKRLRRLLIGRHRRMEVTNTMSLFPLFFHSDNLMVRRLRCLRHQECDLAILQFVGIRLTGSKPSGQSSVRFGFPFRVGFSWNTARSVCKSIRTVSSCPIKASASRTFMPSSA